MTSLLTTTNLYVRERQQSKTFRGNTARSIGSRLRAFVAWAEEQDLLDVADVRVEHVEAWLASDRRQAPGSLRVRLSALAGFYTWARRRGMVTIDPCDGVKPPRAVRAVPRAFTEDMVATLERSCSHTRERLIVALMVQEGLRCCEVANLQVTDLDRREGTILVTGKGGHERVLPLTERVLRALADYEAEFPPPHFGPLIRSIRSARSASKGLTAGSISDIMRRVLTDAGLKHGPRDGVSAHALRHTAASDVLERCGDVRVVQEMLGHASLTTTQIYLRRVSGDRLRRAMEGRDYRASSGVAPTK